MSTAKITEWEVKISLSDTNQKYLKELDIKHNSDTKNIKRPSFTNNEKKLLSKLPIENQALLNPINQSTEECKKGSKNSLDLNNIVNLYNKLHAQNNKCDEKQYLHELLENAQLFVPENEIIPRNPELEERCKKLRMEQENLEYANMTKNVDSARKSLPEDTISYQIKSINKQLIAIFQFVVSVITGFAFGFIGLELIFGGMEFGFRLLLGIICALIIALAEIYFLAKKLNEYDEFIDSPKHNTYTVSASKKSD